MSTTDEIEVKIPQADDTATITQMLNSHECPVCLEEIQVNLQTFFANSEQKQEPLAGQQHLKNVIIIKYNLATQTNSVDEGLFHIRCIHISCLEGCRREGEILDPCQNKVFPPNSQVVYPDISDFPLTDEALSPAVIQADYVTRVMDIMASRNSCLRSAARLIDLKLFFPLLCGLIAFFILNYGHLHHFPSLNWYNGYEDYIHKKLSNLEVENWQCTGVAASSKIKIRTLAVMATFFNILNQAVIFITLQNITNLAAMHSCFRKKLLLMLTTIINIGFQFFQYAFILGAKAKQDFYECGASVAYDCFNKQRYCLMHHIADEPKLLENLNQSNVSIIFFTTFFSLGMAVALNYIVQNLPRIVNYFANMPVTASRIWATFNYYQQPRYVIIDEQQLNEDEGTNFGHMQNSR